jgi:hypothetical protein
VTWFGAGGCLLCFCLKLNQAEQSKMEYTKTEMEYTNFSLTYDGIYHIHSSDGRIIDACLTLDVILKMIEFEGYTINQVIHLSETQMPLEFKKVILTHLVYVTHDGEIDYVSSQLAEPLYTEYDVYLLDFMVKRIDFILQ